LNKAPFLVDFTSVIFHWLSAQNISWCL